MQTAKEARARFLKRWERGIDLPLTILALAMIPTLLGPFLHPFSPQVMAAFETVDWFIWAAFALDLGVRLYLSPARWRYLLTHWLDVLIVILPLLRPLRLMRSARALRLLRLARLVVFAPRAARGLRNVLRPHYALPIWLASVLVCAYLVFVFEKGAGGTVNSFTDSLWWAIVTVATVGYGDTYPITPQGRMVAVVLMLVGIAFFGIIAANLATFLLGGRSASQDKTLEELLKKMEELERLLKERAPR